VHGLAYLGVLLLFAGLFPINDKDKWLKYPKGFFLREVPLDAIGRYEKELFAYGREASARSWARRSFAAETIFMAFVICCVFFTLRIRRRMSMRLAMRGRP